LEREGVAEVTLIPGTPDGRPDSDRAREALAQGPALISLMHVNNETGIIQPIDEWADSARAANPDVIVHCDAVQAIPRLAEIAPKADLVVLSGHKIHGPPGVGLLVARRTLQLAPLILGGPQEGGRRAGTEPLALIAGLDAAVNLALEQQPFAHTQLHMLEEIFRQTLMEAGVRHEINAESSPRVPGLLSLWLPDIESDDLVIAADLEGLALSAASACQSGTPERSHVLHAMGLSSERIRHTVRVGFHRNQLPGDACEAAERIAAVVARTRR
jgi:cysteine desulfurase